MKKFFGNPLYMKKVVKKIRNELGRRFLGSISVSDQQKKKTASQPVIDDVSDPTLPQWKGLLANGSKSWTDRVQKNQREAKTRVLIANSLPGYLNGAVVESVLAAGLELRDAHVDVLVCQGTLSACLMMKQKAINDISSLTTGAWKSHGAACGRCVSRKDFFGDLGLNCISYGDHLSVQDVQKINEIVESTPTQEIQHFKLDGCAIGEHAHAGVLRFFAKGNAEDEPNFSALSKTYFRAALETYFVMCSVLKANRYDVAVFHHGIYVPQGIIGEVCRRQGVRVVNWNPAYRKSCFIFSHGDTYHHTLMNEQTDIWTGLDLNSNQEKTLLEYLDSRATGKKDWIWFHNEPDSDTNTLKKETGIDLDKPIIGLLTNVVWDAQLHYPQNAFPDMLTWIRETIAYFSRRPEIQLLIRVHPAEIRGLTPSRQLVVDEVKKWFPELPKNVFVIPPDSEINTYSAMSICDSVIIYGTKTGVELTSRGIPVIVAGEAWIKNKGLTVDVQTSEQYFNHLDRLPVKERMASELVGEARKYAFHFFFRRMVPLRCFVPLDTHKKMPFKLEIGSMDDLAIGKDRGLDVICDGIINGSPFVYRYEEWE